jgi:hypothetical protein
MSQFLIKSIWVNILFSLDEWDRSLTIEMFALGSNDLLGGGLDNGTAKRRAGHCVLGSIQSVHNTLTGHG